MTNPPAEAVIALYKTFPGIRRVTRAEIDEARSQALREKIEDGMHWAGWEEQKSRLRNRNRPQHDKKKTKFEPWMLSP